MIPSTLRSCRTGASKYRPQPISHRAKTTSLEFRCLIRIRSSSSHAILRGPTSPPLLEESIPQHFTSIVKQYGDRPAVISHHQQTTLSYDVLDIRSNAMARGLAKIGVRKGDRCAVMLGNSIEYAIATYALFKLGAILVPLNPAFNTLQVISALNHLGVAHLVISTETFLPRKAGRNNVDMLREIVPGIESSRIKSEIVSSLANIVLVDNSSGRVDVSSLRGTTPLDTVFEDGASGPTPDFSLLKANEIVNIQFTSGTTSTPKAAMLSHRNILNNGKSIGDRMLLTATDIVCCPPPLFHCFGSILGYMATATHGAAIVFPSESFDAKASLQAVQQHGATALYGVPTMFIAELDLLASGEVEHTGFDTLRTGIAAGSAVPSELMRKLHKQLNLTQQLICYGMTESSPVLSMTATDDPIEKRISTVGKLLPHVHAKVVDPQDWTKMLKVGERGELAVSGYLVMQGYWGDEAKTKSVLVPDENGRLWMHTGDEAAIDTDGYVVITGRIKDLIIRGGENIHPLEIESCLLANPHIIEAQIVGLPDEHYGEIVAAFVVRRKDRKSGNSLLGEEDVRSWVRANLSHQLVPKHVFWVDDYPKTASGKIQKFKLREDGIRLVRKQGGLE